jgi:predicted metalloprotease
MQLGGQRTSGNVEDRRGIGMGVGGGIGVGGIVVALIAYFLGFDPGTVISVAEQVGSQREDTREVPKGTPTDETGQFVAKVLGSTEDVWGKLFVPSKTPYVPPTLVLYDGQVRSACGIAQTATGPFYCPDDQKLYLDTSFFRELQTRFRAPGDFAQAYVIAHEVGHHVQKLSGTMLEFEANRRRMSRAQINQLSVRLELQADCYAGVWGHHAGAMSQLDPGDIAEALAAATAIGDDRLQKQTQGRVVPESFTHGTSQQRLHWFKRGFDSGRPADCDTFSTDAV